VDQAGTVVATFLPSGTNFTTCSIDGNGDPWVFGYSSGKAIKLWEVDGTQLAQVALPSGGSAWGGDTGAFHSAMNINPGFDSDGDGYTNGQEIAAGTNPYNANSTPLRPLPIQSGIANPGATVNIGFRLRADANLPFIAAAALSDTPGIPLGDGRVVPLNPDALFQFSIYVQPNPIFVGFQGVLNATETPGRKWWSRMIPR